MLFVKTYAQVSLVVALLMAIYGGVGTHVPQSGTMFEAVMMMVGLLWAAVSLGAVLSFSRAHIWSPALFLIFYAANTILIFMLAMSTKSIDPPVWIAALKHSKTPIYYATVGFAVIFALLNGWYLLKQKKEEPKRS